MDRLIASNTVATGSGDIAPVTGTPGQATNGNPATSTPATVFPAYAWNAIQEELIAVLAAGGVTPDRTNNAQLAAAIKRIGQNTIILVDTGAVNAYTAVNATPLVAGTWINGVVQQLKVANTNTGASTYAPDGLAAIPIYGLGLQPLQANEMFAGGTAILMKQTIAGVNSGNPIAVLYECAGGAQQTAPATQPLHAVQLGQLGNVGVVPGRLLRTSVYSRVAGVQNVSINGGANTTTGATTFTPLAATTIYDAEVQGGGGGSAGCGTTTSTTSAVSGGSGAGAYARGLFTTLSAQAITVGAGGTAGVTGGAGTTGSTSSVGALISSPGGNAGGVALASTNGIQGGSGLSSPPTGGNVLSIRGQGGLPSTLISVNTGISGSGGASMFGAGQTGTTTINTVGPAGVNPGTGGSGSFAGSSNGTGVAGAAGADGIIIIREYA